ncbi:hypothetical protein [Streptomyces sp. NBC_00687]|uniref:hypothetical protein n=1 Tax=Streptomyces sp. NBC_00687 TaxID=2975807 RepID=UPI00225B97BE|nr:hypothetical protein [Streptomyces sp. NBC_00687]MCX4920092.1 hypothetical protein [Streptomyces sp. NBC_00687]
MTMADIQHEETGRKTVTVTVDGEPVEVPQHTTPNTLLGLAGIDAATHYLVRITGRHQHPFDGRGEEEITVHEGETFVSVSTGPTPTA